MAKYFATRVTGGREIQPNVQRLLKVAPKFNKEHGLPESAPVYRLNRSCSQLMSKRDRSLSRLSGKRGGRCKEN